MKRAILVFSFFIAFIMAVPAMGEAQTVIKEYEITSSDNRVFTLFVFLTADDGIEAVDVTDLGYTFATRIDNFQETHGGYAMSAYEGNSYFSDGTQYYTIAFTLPVDGDGTGGDEGLISITPWPYPYPPF